MIQFGVLLSLSGQKQLLLIRNGVKNPFSKKKKIV